MKKEQKKTNPPKQAGKSEAAKKPLYRVPFYVGIRREEKKENAEK